MHVFSSHHLAAFKLKTENPEVYDRVIEYFRCEFDEYSQSSEDAVSEGVKDMAKEMEYEWADQLENMDSKPAATSEPIKTAHLSNPFETLDLPVIAESLIRDGTPGFIEGGIRRNATVVNRTTPAVQGDIMTDLIINVNSMSLKSPSFPFNKAKPTTLMFAPFLEAFLTGDRNIRTSRIIGTSRPDHSRILSPRMHEDISRRKNTTITDVGDVRIIEKLDTTVDGLTANKRNKDSTDRSREILSTRNIFVHSWGKNPTMIGPTCSNYSRRAYVPITSQEGFKKRCKHERRRLCFVERERRAFERHRVYLADDISHDVALNFWRRSVNNGLGMDSTFNSPRSSVPNQIEFRNDWKI